MAEFKAGDRVVKMSGTAAGKYGTVNSVREDGTLNVTFDGERLPRYCDPERCGQVAANAVCNRKGDVVQVKGGKTVRVGDYVQIFGYDSKWHDAELIGDMAKEGDPESVRVQSVGEWFSKAWPKSRVRPRNSRAANAVEFTNPNYRPEAGMRFLDENFSMFDPKVAKAMIEDARRKGVKVPPGVIEKARRAGLIANSRAANADASSIARDVSRKIDKYRADCREMARTIRSVVGTDRSKASEVSHLMPKIKALYKDGAIDEITRAFAPVEMEPGVTDVRLSMENGAREARKELWGALKDAGLERAARNTVARNGVPWTGEEKRALGSAYHPNGRFVRWGRQSVEFIHSGFGKYFVYKDGDGQYSVSFTPTDPYEKGWMKRASSIDEANRIMGTW